jgi:hypothetical protein
MSDERKCPGCGGALAFTLRCDSEGWPIYGCRACGISIPENELDAAAADATKCRCGSGLEREAVHDARGIFVSYVCRECRAEKLAGYRPEIFTDPGYSHDEPLEEQE